MNEDIDFGGAAEARISRLESETVDVADSLHDLTMLWQGIHNHRRVVDHKLGTMDGMLVQANKAVVDLGVGQEEIIDDVRGLRGEVGSLRGDLAGLRSEVGAVQTEVRGLRSDFAAFRDRTDFRFGQVSGEIRQVKNGVSVLTTDVAMLKTDVATLKTDVVELKTDVAGLKLDVAMLKSDVATLKSDVATLKTDMAEMKAMLGQVLVRLPKPRSGAARNTPDWPASPTSATQPR